MLLTNLGTIKGTKENVEVSIYFEENGVWLDIEGEATEKWYGWDYDSQQLVDELGYAWHDLTKYLGERRLLEILF